MKLLNDLLHTDYGLMSIIVITITLGMAVFFIRMFLVKMSEPPMPNPAARAGGSSSGTKAQPPSR